MIVFGPGNDTWDGGAGIDLLTALNSSKGVVIDLVSGNANHVPEPNMSPEFISNVTGIENLIGSKFDDFLGGTSAVNVIEAGEGFDVLSEDYSSQTVNVTVITGNAHSLSFADGSQALNFETVKVFSTGSGNDVLVLNDLDNIISTNAGDDYVDLGGLSVPQDVYNLMGVIVKWYTSETVHGGPGNDTLVLDNYIWDFDTHPDPTRIRPGGGDRSSGEHHREF